MQYCKICLTVPGMTCNAGLVLLALSGYGISEPEVIQANDLLIYVANTFHAFALVGAFAAQADTSTRLKFISFALLAGSASEYLSIVGK